LDKSTFSGRRKQRIASHLGEEESRKIIRAIFPEQWVIRDFDKPDYGIDLVFELFKHIDGERRIYETLGEYIFIQVKSIVKPRFVSQKYHPVLNVAKADYREDKTISLKTEVIKYPLETNDLVTVQAMGSSVCILLILVALDSKRVFFVNLNDLIDKVIIPKKPDFRKYKKIIIDVPVLNELKHDTPRSFAPLEFYAKRAKMLAAFSTFLYQQNEVNYSLQAFNPSFLGPRSFESASHEPNWQEIQVMVKTFLSQILELDIWDLKTFDYFQAEMYETVWKYFSEYHEKISSLYAEMVSGKFKVRSDKGRILLLWFWLGNLNNIYQEVCREWWMPKFLGVISSYPEFDLVASNRKNLNDITNVLQKHFR
jgi:hypothetical protein